MNAQLQVLEVKDEMVITGFKEGINDYVTKIEEEILSIDTDASTAKGRKDIEALGKRINKSKNQMDKLGKEVVSEWKTKSKKVDTERKISRDRLDALREKVERPWKEYEERVLVREQGFLDKIEAIQSLSLFDFHAEKADLNIRLGQIEKLMDVDWEEFNKKAEEAYQSSKATLESMIADLEEKAALKLKAEQEQKDREEQIRKDAEELARKQEKEQAVINAKKAKQKADDDAKALAEKVKADKITEQIAKDKAIISFLYFFSFPLPNNTHPAFIRHIE